MTRAIQYGGPSAAAVPEHFYLLLQAQLWHHARFCWRYLVLSPNTKFLHMLAVLTA